MAVQAPGVAPVRGVPVAVPALARLVLVEVQAPGVAPARGVPVAVQAPGVAPARVIPVAVPAQGVAEAREVPVAVQAPGVALAQGVPAEARVMVPQVTQVTRLAPVTVNLTLGNLTLGIRLRIKTRQLIQKRMDRTIFNLPVRLEPLVAEANQRLLKMRNPRKNPRRRARPTREQNTSSWHWSILA